MEHQKILNLLDEANDSKFMTRKWNIVNDQSHANYDVANEIFYNAKVLKSNLFYYNAAYILVRGDIATTVHNIKVAFKNCAPFIKCIKKIDGTTVDDAEDLDLLMSMYNLIEYSSNYSEVTRSLWFYSKNQATNFNADIANNHNIVLNLLKIRLKYKETLKLIELMEF